MDRKTLLVVIPSVALVLAAGILSAGPLDPPAGSVAPTYKTLTEVAPRTTVSAANTPGDADSTFAITAPGSYYLTGNVAGQAGKNGIKITSRGVTLDLSGFRVAGTAGSLAGIKLDSFTADCVIRNGDITGWSAGGIIGSNGEGPLLIEAVNVSQIPAGAGISVRGPATITNCRVAYAKDFGIQCVDPCTVTRCSAAYCGNDGISVGVGASVADCSSYSNTGEGFSSSGDCAFRGCAATYNTGVGILAGIGSAVVECTGGSNGAEGIRGLPEVRIANCSCNGNATGILALDGCTVESCTVAGNAADGIKLGNSCHAINNHSRGNGANGTGCGVYSSGIANRIDGNSCVDNDYGIRVTALDNVVVRNTARNNATANYSFPNGAEYGQILTNPGSAFVATNPWANFAY